LNEAAAFPDDVEQIAVFSGRGIGLLASCSLPPMTLAQPNEHGPAARLVNVTDDPIAANAPAIGKILPADEFGPLGEPAGEIGYLD
jgi:hypothetical protein